MNIKLLSSASQDLIDGYWFYEKHRAVAIDSQGLEVENQQNQSNQLNFVFITIPK